MLLQKWVLALLVAATCVLSFAAKADARPFRSSTLEFEGRLLSDPDKVGLNGPLCGRVAARALARFQIERVVTGAWDTEIIDVIVKCPGDWRLGGILQKGIEWTEGGLYTVHADPIGEHWQMWGAKSSNDLVVTSIQNLPDRSLVFEGRLLSDPQVAARGHWPLTAIGCGRLALHALASFRVERSRSGSLSSDTIDLYVLCPGDGGRGIL